MELYQAMRDEQYRVNPPAVVLLTVAAVAIVATAASPFAPGAPLLPGMGPMIGIPPTPWRDDEPTSLRVTGGSHQIAQPMISASGAVSTSSAYPGLTGLRIT